MAIELKKLEDGLQINQHALDDALRIHPDLFYKVATELALAISLRDEAKQNLDEVEAEADIDIRAVALRMNEKATDKSIEAQKKVDDKVVAATEAFMKAKLEAAKWTALKEAYEARSYALSKLVDLHLASYYSSNEEKRSGGGNLRDARAQHVKTELAARRRVTP